MDRSKPRAKGGGSESAHSTAFGAATAAGQSPAKYWRSFPHLEGVLQAERPPLIEKMAETCRKLDVIIKTGSAQEKQRAQAAMTAYARTLELYRRVEEALTQESNRSTVTHDK